MAMDLTKETFSTEPEYFIAGTAVGIAKAVKEADGDVKAHAPVAISDGKVVKITATAINNAEVYGITADSAKDGGEAVVYLTGEFFADALALEDGVTASALELKLREKGIFLK